MTVLAEWRSLANDLVSACLEMFPKVQTGRGYRDTQLIGLTVLARTLSNLKGALVLLDHRRVVEARVLTRCCLENAFWVQGLVRDGDAFVRDMLGDDARHRIRRGERLLKGAPLDDETRGKLRARLKEIGTWYQNPKQLNPSGVANRSVPGGQAYNFYEDMSADAAHPSFDALNRYVLPPTDSEAEGIEVEPAVDDIEIVETLEYLSLGVLGVYFGVNDLLGGTPSASGLNGLAARHVELSQRTRTQERR